MGRRATRTTSGGRTGARAGPLLTTSTLQIDPWPDMTEYTPGEQFAVPGFTYPDGAPRLLFSSDEVAHVAPPLPVDGGMEHRRRRAAAVPRLAPQPPAHSHPLERAPRGQRDGARVLRRIRHVGNDRSGHRADVDVGLAIPRRHGEDHVGQPLPAPQRPPRRRASSGSIRAGSARRRPTPSSTSLAPRGRIRRSSRARATGRGERPGRRTGSRCCTAWARGSPGTRETRRARIPTMLRRITGAPTRRSSRRRT